MIIPNFDEQMRRDSSKLAEVFLAVVKRYQHNRALETEGFQMVAVEMAGLAYVAAVVVRQLPPAEQQMWRDFLVGHFDKALKA